MILKRSTLEAVDTFICWAVEKHEGQEDFLIWCQTLVPGGFVALPSANSNADFRRSEHRNITLQWFEFCQQLVMPELGITNSLGREGLVC